MYRNGELPPYEVICLWTADILLLLDNTTLILKHWSINEPLMVSVSNSMTCVHVEWIINDYQLLVLQEGGRKSDIFQYFIAILYVDLRNSREAKSTSGVGIPVLPTLYIHNVNP